jgi:hypothetical protein
VTCNFRTFDAARVGLWACGKLGWWNLGIGSNVHLSVTTLLFLPAFLGLWDSYRTLLLAADSEIWSSITSSASKCFVSYCSSIVWIVSDWMECFWLFFWQVVYVRLQAFFQRWWRNQNDMIKDTVKGLISSGRLELMYASSSSETVAL